MKWHCGLLDDKPNKNRVYSWLMNYRWGSLPQDVADELEIWLAMPGFAKQFHAHTLNISPATPAFLARHNLYDKWKPQVAENWMSCTRDDAVKLSRIRPPGGDIPLVSQYQIMDDIKAGGRIAELSREYLTDPSKIVEIRRGLIRMRADLPVGFARLLGRS